jgi:hypothetical protein
VCQARSHVQKSPGKVIFFRLSPNHRTKTQMKLSQNMCLELEKRMQRELWNDRRWERERLDRV